MPIAACVVNISNCGWHILAQKITLKMTVTNICVCYCANYKSQWVKWLLSYIVIMLMIYMHLWNEILWPMCIFYGSTILHVCIKSQLYWYKDTVQTICDLLLMRWQIQKSNWIEVDLHFSTYNTTYIVFCSIISMSCHNVNSRPLVPHVGPRAGTSLVHAMACRLFDVEPLTEPVMTSHHSQPM